MDRTAAYVASMSLALCGCGGGPASTDASVLFDSGVDVGDAGVVDGATPDALVPDAFVPDAFVPDAFVPDAGPVDGSVTDAGAPAETVMLAIAMDVPPLSETTICSVVEAGRVDVRQIGAIRSTLSGRAFVLVVSRTTAPLSEPAPCGSGAGFTQPLWIGQSADDSLTMPPAAAFPLAAGERLLLMLHAVNLEETAMPASAVIHLELLAGSDPPRAPAQMFFGVDLSLSIPAGATVTEESFHAPPEALSVFALTTRTHSLGVRTTVRRAAGPSDTMGALVYESTNWADPLLALVDPPLVLEGGAGLRLACEYTSTRPDPVGGGDSYADEHCGLFAYGYRAE